MRFRMGLAFAAVLLLCFATIAEAQRQGGRGRGGSFGGTSLLALLGIEAVQKELDLVEDQLVAIRKLQEESRAARFGGGRRPGGGDAQGRGRRPGGGEGRRPGGNRPGGDRPDNSQLNQRGEIFVQAQNQEQPQRRFQDLSDEERQKLREERSQQAADRAKQEKAKLAEILLPHQMKRLNEIYVQVLGTRALENAEIAKKLKITEKQATEIREVRQAGSDELRSQLRELFQSGDRDKIRAKFTELREAGDKKVLGVLTSTQTKEFEAMKGKLFEMPEGGLRGGFRGRGGGQGRPGGGRPGGQNRPGRPDA